MQFLGQASFSLPELALEGPAESTSLLGYRGGLTCSLRTTPCSEHLSSPARKPACAMCAHEEFGPSQLSSTIFLPPRYLGAGCSSASTTATPLPPLSDILPRHRLRAFSGLGGTSTMVRSYQPLLFAMQFLGQASFSLPELALEGPAESTSLLGYRGGLTCSLRTTPCSEHLSSPAREPACAMCAYEEIGPSQLSSTIFLPPRYLGAGSSSTSTTATPLPPVSDILPHHRLRAFSGLGGTSTMVRAYQPLLFAMQFLGLASFSLPELALEGPAESTSLLGYRGGLTCSLRTTPCSEHLSSPAREPACAMCAYEEIGPSPLSSTMFLQPRYLGAGSSSASTTATPPSASIGYIASPSPARL
ncbi:hypothetical protein MTO96_035550 [Rhipicephalus appendiculatus]